MSARSDHDRCTLTVKEIHDRRLITCPDARPQTEVTESRCDEEPTDVIDDFGIKSTDEAIRRTTRLARGHGFDAADSGRVANGTCEDTRCSSCRRA